MSTLLEIRGLTVDFSGTRTVRAVDGIDLAVAARERRRHRRRVRLRQEPASAGVHGTARGERARVGLRALRRRRASGAGRCGRGVRGRGIGFVFQDAGGSLTPHRRIGDQLAEVAAATLGLTARRALEEATDILARVRLPDPAARLAQYPHELSGGMRQRVALALALVARPRLLFADEPTTALDVTVQAEIMALLAALCDDLGMALLLVTHDLGVVAALADRIAVMKEGRLVETSPAASFLQGPRDAYSRALLAAVPTLAGPA